MPFSPPSPPSPPSAAARACPAAVTALVHGSGRLVDTPADRPAGPSASARDAIASQTVRLLLCIGLVAIAACGSGAPAPPLVPATREPALSAEWWNGAVVYEVFVRSFSDSDGDGKGDLAGLIKKLDYLNDGDPATGTDLGIDAIWLMPIYASPSYHGYDVTDYDGVNPDYGSSATMDALIAECHRRGVKDILCFGPHHTPIQPPWFASSHPHLYASGAPDP